MMERWPRTLTYLLLLCSALLWGVIESIALLRSRCCDAWPRTKIGTTEYRND